MKITIKVLLLSISLVLFNAGIGQTSTWTLPNDFADNTAAYPSVGALPVYTIPGALTTAGRITTSGTYFLTKDIYSRAEAFFIEADNVTINLNGYNIIYACENYPQAYGISLPPTYNHALFFPRGQFASGSNNNFTLKDTIGGGSITKGIGFPAEKSSAIFAYEIEGLTVTDILINHSGIAASGIETHYLSGNVTIKNVTTNYEYVRDGKPIIDPAILLYPTGGDGIHWYWVINRHSEFVGSIVLKESKMDSCTISDNSLRNSPQMGIYIADVSFSPPTQTRDDIFFESPNSHAYKTLISSNTIELNAKITNCYGLKLDTSNANIFNNSISGYGAGIHVGGKYLYIHHNTVDVTQGANPEYITRLWAHGLKIEGTSVSLSRLLPDQCLITENSITVSTRGPLEYKDPTFWYTPGTPNHYYGHNGGARVLDLSPSMGTWNEIRGNTFRGERLAADHPTPNVMRLTSVNMFDVVPTSTTVINNNFETNGYFIVCDWPPKDSKFDSINIESNTYFDIGGTSSAQLVYLSDDDPIATITIKNPIVTLSSIFQNNPYYSVWSGTPSANLRISVDDTLYRELTVINGIVTDNTFGILTCEETSTKCTTLEECIFYWPSFQWDNNICQPIPKIIQMK